MIKNIFNYLKCFFVKYKSNAIKVERYYNNEILLDTTRYTFSCVYFKNVNDISSDYIVSIIGDTIILKENNDDSLTYIKIDEYNISYKISVVNNELV